MNLETKFETLEAQLATQHTAIDNALNAILEALGAPPPTATVTLATVSTQLTALNNNLIGIAIANGSFHSALLSELAQINVNTDTLINNSSLNAQRLLQAILATACACPSTVPFNQLPLDVTPTDLVGEAKCRRIQFYLSIFGAMVDGIANYGGAGAMVTAAAITEIMYAAALSGGLVGAEVGVVAGPPGIALGAIVGIIGAAIGALGSSYLFTLSAQWHTAPLYDQLLAALYAADSADEGSEAFYAVINASEVLNTPFKPLLNALWWNDWSNEVYGATPVVDDSAFDGTICASDESEGCTEYTSIDSGGYKIVHFGEIYAPDPSHTSGNWNGWTFRLVEPPDTLAVFSVTRYGVAGNFVITPYYLSVGSSVTIPEDTSAVGVYVADGSGITYTVQVCEPEL